MEYVCKSMNNMNLYKQLQKMSICVKHWSVGIFPGNSTKIPILIYIHAIRMIQLAHMHF